MASNQPRPWFRLGSFVRPAQPPPPRPPAPTPAPQQPIVRPAAPQIRPPAPQPSPPRETAPAAPPAPRSPPPPAAPAPRSPKAPSPELPSAPTPRSPLRTPIAPSPPAAPLPRSPLRSPPATPPPAFTVPPRSSPAAPAPSSPAARTTATSPSPSPTIRSPTSLQTSPSKKPPSPAPSTTLAITSSSLPASPTRKVSAPSSYTTSPTIKPAAPSRSPPPYEPLSTAAVPTTTITNNHSHPPVSSPRTVKPFSKTPPHSPQMKPIFHPPSPLTLPPAQIKAESHREPKMPTEIEQKTVVQETTEKTAKMSPTNSNGYGQRHFTTHKKYLDNDKGKDAQKKLSDSEEYGMRVITLAGENKGAIMELSPASRSKTGNRNGRKLGTDYGNENEEERSNMKDKNQKAMSIESPPMTAFMNSNVQGVNNSILYNCSCAHNDPGVHLSFTRKANGGHANRLKDHTRD